MDKDQIRFMGEFNELKKTVKALVTEVKNLKVEVERLDRENRKLRGDVDFLAGNAPGAAK